MQISKILITASDSGLYFTAVTPFTSISRLKISFAWMKLKLGSSMYCITERWLLYFSLGLIHFSATIIGIGDGKALQAFSFILCQIRIISLFRSWLWCAKGGLWHSLEYSTCMHGALLCFDNWIWASNKEHLAFTFYNNVSSEKWWRWSPIPVNSQVCWRSNCSSLVGPVKVFGCFQPKSSVSVDYSVLTFRSHYC